MIRTGPILHNIDSKIKSVYKILPIFKKFFSCLMPQVPEATLNPSFFLPWGFPPHGFPPRGFPPRISPRDFPSGFPSGQK